MTVWRRMVKPLVVPQTSIDAFNKRAALIRHNFMTAPAPPVTARTVDKCNGAKQYARDATADERPRPLCHKSKSNAQPNRGNQRDQRAHLGFPRASTGRLRHWRGEGNHAGERFEPLGRTLAGSWTIVGFANRQRKKFRMRGNSSTAGFWTGRKCRRHQLGARKSDNKAPAIVTAGARRWQHRRR